MRSPKTLTSCPTQSSAKFASRAKRRYGDWARGAGTATPAPAVSAGDGTATIGLAGACAVAKAPANATPAWNSPAAVGRMGAWGRASVARRGALGRVMDE